MPDVQELPQCVRHPGAAPVCQTSRSCPSMPDIQELPQSVLLPLLVHMGRVEYLEPSLVPVVTPVCQLFRCPMSIE